LPIPQKSIIDPDLMKIPEPNTLVKVQHFGRVIEALVQDVKPDPQSRFRRLVTLSVTNPVAMTDRFQWIDEDGIRTPAQISEVAQSHGAIFVTLQALD
jgi:hypothetical protein